MFYALFSCSFFLLLWAILVKNTGNGVSFIFVKVIPGVLGLWGFWECAIYFVKGMS